MKTKDQENLDGVLQLKAEKKRRGSDIPDFFEYQGKLFDTNKTLDALCNIYERKVAQSGGAS